MKFEISALFGMEAGTGMARNEVVGSGIFIQEIITNGILENLFKQVRETDEGAWRRMVVRQEAEHWLGGYSHRFFVEFEAPSRSSSEFREVQQQVLRAIVLSRIIKPLPISINPTIVLTSEGRTEVFTTFDFYGTAYIYRPNYAEGLTKQDTALMAEYWPEFENLFAHRRTKYQRLFRAIWTFNNAYHIIAAELKHVVIHSAVETLICTSRNNNKNQVVKRLPKMADGTITEAQTGEAYDFCGGVRHAAEPALLSSEYVTDLHPDDEKRIEAARMLDEALRYLFIKALKDPSFADLLENKTQLAKMYPV
jgi:hypothetical protein